MPYTVIRPFKDMRDEEQHEYQIDDVFPRKGYEPDQEFVKGLLTGFNLSLIHISEPTRRS